MINSFTSDFVTNTLIRVSMRYSEVRQGLTTLPTFEVFIRPNSPMPAAALQKYFATRHSALTHLNSPSEFSSIRQISAVLLYPEIRQAFVILFIRDPSGIRQTSTRHPSVYSSESIRHPTVVCQMSSVFLCHKSARDPWNHPQYFHYIRSILIRIRRYQRGPEKSQYPRITSRSVDYGCFSYRNTLGLSRLDLIRALPNMSIRHIQVH